MAITLYLGTSTSIFSTVRDTRTGQPIADATATFRLLQADGATEVAGSRVVLDASDSTPGRYEGMVLDGLPLAEGQRYVGEIVATYNRDGEELQITQHEVMVAAWQKFGSQCGCGTS